MAPVELAGLTEKERDELKKPWLCVPCFARVALELQENDEVRVTLFGLRKLPLTYLNE